MAERLVKEPKGTSFHVSWAKSIDWRVVSPFVEFAWHLNDPLFDEGLPRLLQVREQEGVELTEPRVSWADVRTSDPNLADAYRIRAGIALRAALRSRSSVELAAARKSATRLFECSFNFPAFSPMTKRAQTKLLAAVAELARR